VKLPVLLKGNKAKKKTNTSSANGSLDVAAVLKEVAVHYFFFSGALVTGERTVPLLLVNFVASFFSLSV